jgi:hypothetical protein
MQIIENKKLKIIKSYGFNSIFEKSNGHTLMWGITTKDNINFKDPKVNFLPLILDLEITTICNGQKSVKCGACYKSNTLNGKNMSLETFKKIFHNLPKTIQQIAFGLDASCTSNPETFDIMQYTRDNGIIPNCTVANVSRETSKKLAKVCGAVAVSRYTNKQICYDSIKRLQDAGLYQTNMHMLVHSDNYVQIMETLNDYVKGDIRPHAIVLLSLKKVGRGSSFQSLSLDLFKKIVNFSLEQQVPIGFDSCSAPKFVEAIKDRPDYKKLLIYTEPCESTLLSIYINVEGKMFPCSFTEHIYEGIDIINNKFEDVWNHKTTLAFRNKLLSNIDINGQRNCPVFGV